MNYWDQQKNKAHTALRLHSQCEVLTSTQRDLLPGAPGGVGARVRPDTSIRAPGGVEKMLYLPALSEIGTMVVVVIDASVPWFHFKNSKTFILASLAPYATITVCPIPSRYSIMLFCASDSRPPGFFISIHNRNSGTNRSGTPGTTPSICSFFAHRGLAQFFYQMFCRRVFLQNMLFVYFCVFLGSNSI